jgi:hypothetical protein
VIASTAGSPSSKNRRDVYGNVVALKLGKKLKKDATIPKPVATPYTTCGDTQCSRVFASESDAATADTRPSSTTPYATIGY